ncbi:unnamed protein product [Caenorhabditis sp. 36 PRJEB53466]|nr:unnamed protein product [Caenorhabditis sp. 36 PRJEB53466]
MSDVHWIHITNITGAVGLALSLSSNSILLGMVLSKMSPIRGVYKNILIFYCIFTMFYSAVEIFLMPLIHIYDDTLFVMQRKWFDMNSTVSHFTTTVYCGCYAMSFVLFALQFLYRYVATCKPFENENGARKVITLNIIGIVQHVIVMTVSFGTLFFCAFKTYSTISKHKGISCKTRELQVQLFRALVVQATIPTVFMYCPLLFLYGCPLMNIQLGAMANYQTIIGQLYSGVDPFAIIFLITAYRRTLIIKKHESSTSSSQTRCLQLQLFRALVVQTLIPVFFNFIPLMFLYICPILDVQLGPRTNYQVIMAQLYPALDPIVMLFIIEDYRSTLIEIMRMACKNDIAVYDYDQSQYTDFMRTENESGRVTTF